MTQGSPPAITAARTDGAADVESAAASQGVVPSLLVNERSQDSDRFHEESTPGWTAHYLKDAISMTNFFPPTIWVPRYIRTITGKATPEDEYAQGLLKFSLIGDLIAGCTVGIMLVPQCLAFAMLAALPVQCGLYSSFMPLVMYALLGTIRQVNPGPTALISLLTGQALDSMMLTDPYSRMSGAAFLALTVSLMSLLLGFLRTGFIVDFMSHSVMGAFCTAAGITIASSQLRHMLGLNVSRQKYWWKTVKELVKHLGEADVPTVVMGFSLLFVLLTLKYWKSAGDVMKRKAHPIWRFLPKEKTSKVFRMLKFIADLSSLLCVVIGWLWGYAYRSAGVEGVALIGHVNSTGFIFMLPGGGEFDSLMNETLFINAALITIVGFLETMAVGGKFAAQSRYSYDPNQELIALGAANAASAVMGGYPVTGSFSRTAVNAQFGGTSLFACAISAFLVFLAVYVLLPVIALLPLASLAPIIIQGAMGVINFKDFVTAFKVSPSEFLVMMATLVMSLALTVKEGLLVGFILSVLKNMYDLANPNLVVLGRLSDGTFRDIRNFPQAEQLPGAVMIRMDARLNFVNTRKMKEFALKAVSIRETMDERMDYVVVDMKSINHVDLTGGEMLEVLAETLNGKGQKLILTNLKGPVGKMLSIAHVSQQIQKHGGHVCIDMQHAVKIMTKVDPIGSEAHKALVELVKSVDRAKVELAATAPALYKCVKAKPVISIRDTDTSA